MMNPNMFGSNDTTQFNNQIILDQDQNNPYLHFPDPFLDAEADADLFFSQFLSQQQPQEQNQNQNNELKQMNSEKKMKKKKKIIKRVGKKDRHSKICTAHGPRDRRMRLSLQIARKFFDLQDMLGFDKASKTIDWLLSNSVKAITDLKHNNNNNNNNNSVCSGSSEVINNVGGGAPTAKEARQLRIVAKESRDRARARARQRTMLKKTQQDQNFCFNFQHVNYSELHQDQDTHSKVVDLSDFPPIHSFCSGNHYDAQFNHDYSCPNSIFMASPISKPYPFSDSTLLKLP